MRYGVPSGRAVATQASTSAASRAWVSASRWERVRAGGSLTSSLWRPRPWVLHRGVEEPVDEVAGERRPHPQPPRRPPSESPPPAILGPRRGSTHAPTERVCAPGA